MGGGGSGVASARVGALVDVLVPPRCAGCDQPVAQARWPLCPPCGAALAACALPRAPVALAPGVRAVGAYRHADTARAVLLAAKTRGRRAVLPVLAALLRSRLSLPPPGHGLAWTWIPPGARTRRLRGVDVPAALAGHEARRLLRPAHGGAGGGGAGQGAGQTGRSAVGRRRGARGRYVACGPVPPAVVLVDDVRTTGSTAVAAAEALQAAGARRVLVATFSVTPDPATGA